MYHIDNKIPEKLSFVYKEMPKMAHFESKTDVAEILKCFY